MGLHRTALLGLVLACVALPQPVEAARSGAMYRCTDADGTVAFQDRPCETARGEDRIVGGEQALRRWLEDQRGPSPRTVERSAATPGAQTSRPQAAPTRAAQHAALAAPAGISERRLAICSERFLACAHGDPVRMDRCVARLPRCGEGAAACCPASCLDRYAALRSAGNGLADAVQGALFGAMGCATAR